MPSLFLSHYFLFFRPEDQDQVCEMSVSLKEKEMIEAYRHSLLTAHKDAINPFAQPQAKQE